MIWLLNWRQPTSKISGTIPVTRLSHLQVMVAPLVFPQFCHAILIAADSNWSCVRDGNVRPFSRIMVMRCGGRELTDSLLVSLCFPFPNHARFRQSFPPRPMGRVHQITNAPFPTGVVRAYVWLIGPRQRLAPEWRSSRNCRAPFSARRASRNAAAPASRPWNGSVQTVTPAVTAMTGQ